MRSLIMSDVYPGFCRELSEKGYHIIPTETVDYFHLPEQRHADMQLLIIDGRLFKLSDCEKTVMREYPNNVLLNCLYHNHRLYGNVKAIDPVVIRYCKEQNIPVENVNQGYSRCSVMPVNDNAVITADRSLQKALVKNGAEVLLIQPGDIRLDGYPYGFIGGAGFTDNDTVFFFGNVRKHPDYEKIKVFCNRYDSKIEILCPSEPLTDIGGAVLINSPF